MWQGYLIWNEKVFLEASFCPPTAVEVAVAYCFADMDWLDLLGAGKVGNGAGDFQNAVVGTGTHIEARHSIAEYHHRVAVEMAMLAYQLR